MRILLLCLLILATIGTVSPSIFHHGEHKFSLTDELLHKLKKIATDSHLGQFLLYKAKFGKAYESGEMEQHLKHFIANLVRMEEHTIKHRHCKFGLTKFADWAQSDFKKVLGLRYVNPDDVNTKVEPDNRQPTATIPTSLDYREKNQVSSVKDQKHCGSCWAFAAASVIESQYLIHKKESLDLSEEHIVHCDTYTHGCAGGDDRYALWWVSENQGILTEAIYPYTATNGTCAAPAGKKYKITKPEAIEKSEAALVEALAKYGPISAGINVPPELQHYTGGIIDISEAECAKTSLGGHAISIVGYTPEYWIIKNSWSANWGEEGYFRAKRGNNFCNIVSHASAAIFA
uniref:Pept_C1 domain-containing protein n=1 Tax=Panagrellus redivivus TaxID=6233 RepID=A0A7E4VJR6_PANRE